MKIIKIDDFYLNQIKSILAYPIVEMVHLDDEQIKQFCIWPAMYRYFLKWPIQVENQIIHASTEMIIPFPDDDTIGLIDLRTVGKTGLRAGTPNGQNSRFWDIIQYNQNLKVKISDRNLNPEGLKYLTIMQQNLIGSISNFSDTFSHEVNYSERNIRVFSTSVNAQLLFTWAKTSNNFGMIKPTRILDVIELSKSYLLRHLASVGSMLSDSGSEKQINVDALNSRADTIEEKITTLWQDFPDIIALRMS